MIAVDTNILVHAHRGESPWHVQANQALQGLSDSLWAIPWPCIHEFLSIVTHPRIFNPPTPGDDARQAVAMWLEAPGLRVIGEAEGYWQVLEEVLRDSRVSGPRVHDARIAALCRQHGIDEIWSADRDFGRFAVVRAHNPLVG